MCDPGTPRHAGKHALPRAAACDSCMNAGCGTLRCQEPSRRDEMPPRRPCVGMVPFTLVRPLPASCGRVSQPLLLALVVALISEAQAQSQQDITWAGGVDPWARARTSFAKFVGGIFAIELLLWALHYGWRHARDQYRKPMVERRATVRLKRYFDAEAALKDRHSKLKAAGDTHEMYLTLRRAAEAELSSVSPRHGGGNAKGSAPYNPHKQFKRDARSGNVNAFTAWQREDEVHQHHELLLDGRRAALV